MAEFENSAKRSEKLPPLEDIPLEALMEIAKRFEIGETKYGRFNWKTGGPEFFRQAIPHAIRHLYMYANNDEREESNVSNLAATAWGCLILLWWEKTGKAEWEAKQNDNSR